MSGHSRPVDPDTKLRSKKVQSPKAVKSSTTLSRTVLNRVQAWPFPSDEAKRTAEQATLEAAKPKGLRYIDAQGVERVYSRKARHADQTGK